MKVLIVDDDDFTLNLLEHTLEQLGHSTVRAQSGQEALKKLSSEDIRLVITDWDMPQMSGIELCRNIRNDEMHAYIYLIMLSGRDDAKSRREGLGAGADDFLFKPLDADDLMVCFKTAERILALETRDAALFALAKLAESRDPDTGAHVERVQTYARLLARHLSPTVRELHHVNPDFIRMLYQTSALHDLGKVGIPDRILLKPGKLTAEEFEVMKTHATLGSITLDAALHRYPNAKFLRMARDIAASHHERFDGSGYPEGLSGERIPMCARLVMLADVYDALTSRRVYKQAMTHETARQFIIAGRDRSFDPDVVDAFIAGEKEFIEVRAQVVDPVTVLIASPLPETSSQSFDDGPPILVVEDSTTLLHSLTDLIATTGRRVLSATNVADGMRLFNEHHPEVVVSDWEMPGGTGLEMCMQVRNHATGRPVHFIMLTVHSDERSVLRAYAAGVNDYVAKPFSSEELLARVKAGLRVTELHHELAQKSDRLTAANSQLNVANARLDRLAITDELTGLFNRRHAMCRLEEQWQLANRYKHNLTIAALDIDFFKRANDNYGHEAGDVVLQQVAVLLGEATRGTDIVCRVGGEEFLIIFPQQSATQVRACVDRIQLNISLHRFKVQGRELNVTISIGVASRNPEMNQFSELLRAADDALYEAKRLGRNRVKTHEADLADPAKAAVTNLTSTHSEPPAKCFILNMDAIIEQCSGDRMFAHGIIERFREQVPQEMKRLDDGLAAHDVEAFRRAAHTVKSMSAYLQANNAAELCRQLEELAKSDKMDAGATLVNALHQEIQSINEWLTLNANTAEQVAA
jgi:putative two-component system response regulator